MRGGHEHGADPKAALGRGEAKDPGTVTRPTYKQGTSSGGAARQSAPRTPCTRASSRW